MKNIAALLAATLCTIVLADGPVDPCGENLGTWLGCNNPRVVEFLSGLSSSQIGKALKGVRLTDGTVELASATYLGPIHVPEGVHAFLFEAGKARVAYLWVEEGGKEFPLPTCPDQRFDEHSVLSGDVYTWSAAQPGHGIVRIQCPPAEWAPP